MVFKVLPILGQGSKVFTSRAAGVISRKAFRPIESSIGASSFSPFLPSSCISVREFSGRVNSDGSDSDFAPESKVDKTTEDQDGMQEFLKNAVANHDVLLFMKGSPEAPQCGFSSKVSQILKAEQIDFSSADVLSSIEVREGVKKFSDWPTIPQLYVQGEFVGGCDIVTDMYESGELTELLQPIKEKQKAERETE
mmetsp:Transcript_15216/g.17231  ORF Transcript_15216/g.17231 Transcript_15216/m.17231 type:complete len:195 (-) Transcript_15216:1811-2395(-)